MDCWQDSESENQNKIKKVWTTEMTLELISAIEEKENLWDIRIPTYKHREARELAWVDVASRVQVTKADANDKWRLLRQQFRNALAKIKKGKREMPSKHTKPPNEFFNAMLFMLPVFSLGMDYSIDMAPATLPDQEEEILAPIFKQSSSDVDDFNPSLPASPSPGPSTPKRSRKYSEKMSEEPETKAIKFLTAKEESSEHIWARYVASVMTNYPNPEAVLRFKFRVNRLLEQLEVGEFDSPTMGISTKTRIKSEINED